MKKFDKKKKIKDLTDECKIYNEKKKKENEDQENIRLIEELTNNYIEACRDAQVPPKITYAAAGSAFLKMHIILGLDPIQWIKLTQDMVHTVDWEKFKTIKTLEKCTDQVLKMKTKNKK